MQVLSLWLVFHALAGVRCMHVMLRPPTMGNHITCSLVANPAANPGTLNAPNEAMFQDAVHRCEMVVGDDAATDASLKEVPMLLRSVFDADFERYLEQSRRQAQVQNLTCISPIHGATPTEVALRPGRTCTDGACSGVCSRLMAPHVATQSECEELCRHVTELLASAPAGSNLRIGELATLGNVRATLLVVRLFERLRRATAHEYGLPLASVAPHSPFVSQWVFRGDEGSHTPVHCDEAICGDYHYSSVLHLTSQGDGFEGGDFVFSDSAYHVAHPGPQGSCAQAPAPAARQQKEPAGREEDVVHFEAEAESTDGVHMEELPKGWSGAAGAPLAGMTGRCLTRVAPQRGRALVFSSGWENLHFVDVIDSGVRHALVGFFMTRPQWALDGADDMRGPVEATDVAGALVHYFLCPVSDEDEGQFTMLWHSIFAAPLVEDGIGRL